MEKQNMVQKDKKSARAKKKNRTFELVQDQGRTQWLKRNGKKGRTKEVKG